METVRRFLIKLSEKIPEGENQRHNITVDDNGEIKLTLMLENKFIPFRFNYRDYDRIENNMNDVIDELYESVEEYIY